MLQNGCERAHTGNMDTVHHADDFVECHIFAAFDHSSVEIVVHLSHAPKVIEIEDEALGLRALYRRAETVPVDPTRADYLFERLT